MSRDLSNLFNLVVPSGLQQGAALPAISKVLAFDDLGDFVEERQRIQRRLETIKTSSPRVDFSDFSNHVFFDSAVSKFKIAQDKILNSYPFSGDSESKDLFSISGSQYENYITDQWPRYVGYVQYSGSTYISASDNSSQLYVGSSSLYVSARIAPALPGVTYTVLSVLSGSSIGNYYGYTFLASDIAATFRVLSGAFTYDYVANFPTASIRNKFSTIAAMYDANTQKISLYLDKSKKLISPVNNTNNNNNSNSNNRFIFGPATITVGSNFSGGIGEIRVLHTASELFHFKNYNRPITSEDYVKLNYRFNEGVTGNNQLDQNIIDYSQSGLHGQVVNFNYNFRQSGSTAFTDPGDLILYPTHPDVVAFTSSIQQTAEIYDATNRNYIFRLLPEDILIDDQNSRGLLISFALAMSRYFDDLKTYLDQFDNLRITNYSDHDETPDVMLPLLKKYFGWKVTDHFNDSDPLQFLFGENVKASGSLDVPLIEIRDQFWRRIMNNLPYLYKTKGKRNNIDSFFNVLGINSNLINLKEYGTVNASTISDEYITKQKPMAFISLGPSGSVSTPSLNMSGSSGVTMEVVCQLSTGSAQSDIFSATPTTFSRFSLGAVATQTGTLGSVFYYPPINVIQNVPIFNGKFTHFSLTSDLTGNLTVGIRQSSDGIMTYKSNTSSSLSAFTIDSATVFSWGLGVLVGATSGCFGQARVWNRILSDQDLDAHALNFENVADSQALVSGSGLIAHYALNEKIAADLSGNLNVIDLSRNNNSGSITGLPPLANPYQSFLTNYTFLSPSFDLKWTQNKVRIRNKSKLSLNDLANDTNQVALEFNLTDALNEDIVKIFSTMDSMNNVLGSAINKYRSSYTDLEAYRQMYFSRLTDSLHFTNFFKLFRWFDKKIAQSIRQLLPARTDFIGGEFVVDSHLLERNKYQYQYPIFHTPKDIGTGDVMLAQASGRQQAFLTGSKPLRGTYVRTKNEQKYFTKVPGTTRDASIDVEGQLMPRFIDVNKNDSVQTWQNPGRQLIPLSSSIVVISGTNMNISYNDATGELSGTTIKGLGSFQLNIPLKSGSTVTFSTAARAGPGDSYLASWFATFGFNTTLIDTPFTVNLTASAGAGASGSIFAGDMAGISVSSIPVSHSIFLNAFTIDMRQNRPQVAFMAQGNDTEAVESSTNSVNYRNEYTKRIDDARLAAPNDAIVDSSISNGMWSANGFVSSDVNSEASELHFQGIKKYVPLTARFQNGASSIFSASILSGGAHVYLLTTTLYDPNGYQFTPSLGFNHPATDQFGDYFQGWSIDQPKFGTVLSFKVSGSNVPFSKSDFAPYWFDGAGKKWQGANWLSGGLYFPIPDDPGWYQFSFLMDYPFETSFAVSDLITSGFNAGLHFSIDIRTPSASYYFKECRMDFPMQLTDLGVLYYNRLGNSKTNKAATYRNDAIFGKGNKGMSSGTYFTWQGGTLDAAFSPYVRPTLAKSGRLYGWYYNQPGFNVSSDYGETVERQTVVPASSSWSNVNLIEDAWVMDVAGEQNIFAGVENASVDISVTTPQIYVASYDGGRTFSENYHYTSPYPYNSVTAAALAGNYVYFLSKNTIVRSNGLGRVGTYTVSYNSTNFSNPAFLRVGPAGEVYVSTYDKGLYKSTDHASSFSLVFSSGTSDIAIAPNGWVYVGGVSATDPMQNVLFSSSTGNAGTFSSARIVVPHTLYANGSTYLTVDGNNNVYYGVGKVYGEPQPWDVLFSGDNGRSWSLIDSVHSPNVVSGGTDYTLFANLHVGGNGEVLTMGYFQDPVTAGFQYYQRHAKPIHNQSSIGPLSLAPSYQYVQNQISGTIIPGAALGTVSEYPHFGGLFQMRNIVLGTQDTGRIGTDDNSIVKIQHIGSVVNVLWPDQTRLDAPVAGFGELSIGQSPGKLGTVYSYGLPFDTTNYDHVSLYCYALKQAIGTVEQVQIVIQRRPLTSVGFATDQSVQYISGDQDAYTTALYKDIVHTKQIDYSDMSDTMISYVIDVPLVNVREIRIGARQKNGQSDLNTNFLVWGRFIDSKKET